MPDSSVNNRTHVEPHGPEQSINQDEAFVATHPWVRHYEQGVPAHLEIPDQPLTWLLDHTASRYPGRTALIYYGTRLSIAQPAHHTQRFATALQRLGVHKGERVALALPNIPQYPIAFCRRLKQGRGAHHMKQQHVDYQVVPYPKIRRWLALTYRSVQDTPIMHGLIEVDVTRALAYLREHQATTGEALSFTAFLMACLGKAVDEHKAVQAMRLGRKQLILFEDVDVMTFIEREMHGQKQTIPYTVRAANRKTVRQIHQEIRAAQVQDVAKALEGFKVLLFLPILLSRFLIWMLGRSPQVLKKYWGTVTMTAVGMFGKGAGWGIPITGTLMMTVGGIGEKPGVVDGQITIRDYLSLTISFDHDIIDGAPAARFIERLKELIESGYGLDDSTVESKLAGAEAAAKKS